MSHQGHTFTGSTLDWVLGIILAAGCVFDFHGFSLDKNLRIDYSSSVGVKYRRALGLRGFTIETIGLGSSGGFGIQLHLLGALKGPPRFSEVSLLIAYLESSP